MNQIAIILPISRFGDCVTAAVESCLAAMAANDKLVIIYDTQYNHSLSWKTPAAQFSDEVRLRLQADPRVTQDNLPSELFQSVFGNAQRDYANKYLPDFWGYRVFLDDDDVILPEALEVLRNLPKVNHTQGFDLHGFGVRSSHGGRFYGSIKPGECTGSQFAWPFFAKASWMTTNRCASDFDTLQENLKKCKLTWHDVDIILTRPHEALVG